MKRLTHFHYRTRPVTTVEGGQKRSTFPDNKTCRQTEGPRLFCDDGPRRLGLPRAAKRFALSVRKSASELFRSSLLIAGTALFTASPLPAQIAAIEESSAPVPYRASADTVQINAVGGTGTASHLVRWINATTLGDSLIIQSTANKIGIGDSNPASKLSVSAADSGNVATVKATNTSSGRGVLGTSAGGIGVVGTHTNATGTNPGVQGSTASRDANANGLVGIVSSTSPGSSSAGVRGINNGTSGNGIGVYGSQAGSGFGVYGTSNNGYGVYGYTSSGYGVVGSGNTGVYGSGSTGVYGGGGTYGLYGSGTYGVYGSGSYGVYGSGSTGVYASGSSYGVYASGGSSGFGVSGNSTNSVGVAGNSTSSNALQGVSDTGPGLFAQSRTSSGVDGRSTYGNGVQGISSGSGGTGVLGQNTGGGWAGYFYGNVYVNGNLGKSSGSFQIDHPVEPGKKYLSHSFVESPDMMNVYNGNVTLDSKGKATVRMPVYFEALNRDFRYQLTCIGSYAPVYVSREMKGNSFQIGGGKPGTKVSWQVTGIRHDVYADAHRVEVETDKPAEQIGYYLHPELFGQPESKSVFKLPTAAAVATSNAER
jgi:hypothetical protein